MSDDISWQNRLTSLWRFIEAHVDYDIHPEAGWGFPARPIPGGRLIEEKFIPPEYVAEFQELCRGVIRAMDEAGITVPLGAKHDDLTTTQLAYQDVLDLKSGRHNGPAPDDVIRLLKSPAGYQELFQRAIKAGCQGAVEPDLTKSVFRRVGEYWDIVFAGESKPFHNIDGFGYIAYLLRRPEKAIHTHRLYVSVKGGPQQSAAQAEMNDLAKPESEAEAGKRGFGFPSLPDEPSECLDDQASREYIEHLVILRWQREEANEAGDPDRVEQLETQIASIVVHLSPRWKKKFKSSLDNNRSGVQKAIVRAIEKIRASMPQLADHLDVHIITGSTCRYVRATDPVDWEF